MNKQKHKSKDAETVFENPKDLFIYLFLSETFHFTAQIKY